MATWENSLQSPTELESRFPRKVLLTNDRSVSGNNAYADATGLEVPVTSGIPTRFQFIILWTAAATSTGARFSLNGPSFTNLAYLVRWNTTATVMTLSPLGNLYNQNFTVGTASDASNNLSIIEGIIIPSTNGNLILRFANEVNGSAVTVKAGSSVIHW
jgi:hypothetical protein